MEINNKIKSLGEYFWIKKSEMNIYIDTLKTRNRNKITIFVFTM